MEVLVRCSYPDFPPLLKMEPKIRKAKKETKRPDPKPEITDPITKEVANRHKDITELEIM